MKTMEFCIPADAVAEKGEDGQPVAPEQGDTVSFTVDAKVSRVSGGNLYLVPEKINGTELEADGAPPNSEDRAPTREELIAELQKADGNMS